MKKALFFFILFCFSFTSFGQSKVHFGLNAGFSSWSKQFAEIGVFSSINLGTNFTTLNIAYEDNWNAKMKGYQVSALYHFFVGHQMLNAGSTYVFYTDKASSGSVFRPEIGYSYPVQTSRVTHTLIFNYGYNFSSNRELNNINRHVFRFTIFRPIHPRK